MEGAAQPFELPRRKEDTLLDVDRRLTEHEAGRAGLGELLGHGLGSKRAVARRAQAGGCLPAIRTARRLDTHGAVAHRDLQVQGGAGQG